VQPFPPPPGSSDQVVQAWNDYWEDRASYLLTDVSKVVLTRWADALQRYLLAIAEADEEPTMETVRGASIINPLYRVAQDALNTVEKCEQQLGIGTLNATRLGLAAVAEQRSVAEMNARYEEPEAPQPGGEARARGGKPVIAGELDAETDPRLP
jgi:hypothetical protein